MGLGMDSARRGSGLLVASAVYNWMQTLQYEIAFCGGERNDPAKLDFQHPAIFLIWHEYLQFTLYTHGFCGIKLLISQHQDAEWLTQAAQFLGYGAIRGSSSRSGAVSSLRKMMKDGQHTSIAISPDGPRGPRRSVAPGAVFLASKTQIPIVCIGVAYDRPWRIQRAWDKFAIPRPYSRARTIVGPKIYIPKKLGRGNLARYSDYVQGVMLDLTAASEHWAESGRAMEGCEIQHRRPRPKETVVGDDDLGSQLFAPSRRAA